MPRHAIYYAPPEGEMADAAARWIGRDAVRGRRVVQPRTLPDLARLTAEPRRYGFHGTLKAPFRLAEGWGPDDLAAALDRFAGPTAPARAGPLRLLRLGSFLALVPDGTAAIDALAARVVQAFEPFRAPLTEAEILRRRPDRLTPRQRDLLSRFGYPHVMEEFRFHLTLTGPLDGPEEADRIEDAARDHFGQWLGAPFRIDALSLFRAGPDGVFHLRSRHGLTG